MKLKKIVSLALAGVLAVSMLAGCKGNGTDNAGSSSSEQTNTATGYSAVLAEELKDIAAKSYVTFQNDAKDEAALKDALGAVANDVIIDVGQDSGLLGTVYENGRFADAVDEFMDSADVDWYFDNNITFAANQMMNGTWKVAKLYASNGTINVTNVIKEIADELETANLEDQLVKDGRSDDNAHQSKYSYVVSVSVVNVKGTEDLQMNQSTNVIAVTITRTGVDA